MSQEKSSFNKLIELIKLERLEITSIYFYATLSGLVQLSLPLGIQAIIGFVLGASMVTSVYVLIFLIILGTLGVGLLRINQMHIIEKIQQKIFTRYAFDFAESIPNFDLKGIDHYYLPEKINRFFDTITVQKGISKLLLDIPVATIQILLGLLLLSFYHPLFIAFDIILIVILFVLLRSTYKSGLKSSVQESNYKYEVLAWLQEMGRVIKSFKYSQGTHLNLIKTDEKVLKYILARTAHYKVLSFQFRAIVFFKVSVTALMLILGTYLLFNQSLNIGEFVAVEIVIIMVISALEKLIVSLENMYDVITGLIKLDSVLDKPHENKGTHTLSPTQQGIAIEFKNVNFTYDEHTPIFKDMSFKLKHPALIGFSGVEGSGKSSLLKLLTGLYKEYGGLILLDDIPFQNYSLQNLRSYSGILLQEQDVFVGSVYDNITLGRTHITVQMIMEQAKQIGVEDFISFLPNAFDTVLDPMGRKLPTSLVKKILLLRALINEPKLLLMDEPWQGLENTTKRKIIDFLQKKAQTATVIVASNDSDFLSICTQQLNIKNGQAQSIK